MARSAIINVMVQAAMKAGKSLARDFGEVQNLQVSLKGPGDYVSQADRRAEEIIYSELSRARPGYSFLMEERGTVAGDDDQHRWIVDPLDGTTNFLHGIPQYAVSIALIAHAGALINGDQPLDRDTPVIGVVYDPNREELFTGLHGVGAWLNGRRIQCSRAASLAESVVGTGFPFRDFSFADEYMPTLHHAIRHTRGVRRHGAAALDLAWVACGRYDAYWEMGLAPWDVAAGTVLVREAGGICEDIFHADPWPIGGYVYAGNTNTATELDAMIQPHMKPRQSRSSQ